MSNKSKSIWRYNEVTGYWIHERNVEPETEEQWIKIFKKDNPKAVFRISKNKPNKAPKWDNFLRKYSDVKNGVG